MANECDDAASPPIDVFVFSNKDLVSVVDPIGRGGENKKNQKKAFHHLDVEDLNHGDDDEPYVPSRGDTIVSRGRSRVVKRLAEE